MKPFSDFQPSSQEKTNFPPDKVAWARILDKRYCGEVRRIEPYKGLFVIFDSKKDFKPIFEQEVSISYDALFGADVEDSREWETIFEDFIDNKYQDG